MDREEVLGRMSEDAREHVDQVMDMYGAPFARLMGVEIESVDLDRVVASMVLKPEHLNSMGRGHGAAVYALMDHAFAIAANIERPCTGQSSDVSFFRPASGKLTAVCTLVNRSRSLEVHDVKVYGEDGKLVAAGTFTAFAIREGRWPTGAAPTAASSCRRPASPAPGATRKSPSSRSRRRSPAGGSAPGVPAGRGRR